MLKMNGEKGITLSALVITVIVMVIILSITLDLGLSSTKSTRDRKLQAELEIVQQACISEYTKAKQLNFIKEDDSIPENFVGEDITGLPNVDNVNWALEEEDTAIGYKKYYRLTPEDLDSLNIQDSEHTYIVNYYTGEVYNETIRETSKHIPLYIKSVQTHQTDNNIDNTSFVDDNTWYTE